MQRDRSTIHREIKRNSGQRGYRPKQAQRLAEERRVACRRPCKLEDAELHQFVEERLQSVGRPTRWRVARGASSLAAGSVGCRVKRFTIGLTPVRRRGASGCTVAVDRRRNAGKRPAASASPDVHASSIGAAGMATGKETPDRGQGASKCLADDGRTEVGLHADCQSGGHEIGDGDACCGTKLKDLPAALRRSMTFDNGKEFSEHDKITRRLGIDVYFAQPYRSWQRSTTRTRTVSFGSFFQRHGLLADQSPSGGLQNLGFPEKRGH